MSVEVEIDGSRCSRWSGRKDEDGVLVLISVGVCVSTKMME